MKKKHSILICIILVLALCSGTMTVLAADENQIIGPGETYEGDLFYFGGYSFTNDGTVKGDILLLSQTLTNRGSVEGDIIGYSMDANITGDVDGSVRIAGTNANISSKIARNLMIFGNSVLISDQTVIGKNAYIYGGSIKSLAHVKGDTHIYASNVILGGTYEGNVTLNNMGEGTTLDFTPGTVIKGKLIYKGLSKPSIPTGVEIGGLEFVALDPASGQQKPVFDFLTLFKKLVTLLVYYLFGLLLYKLFPRFFVRTGDFIAAKPLSAVGIGIASLGTLVGSVLLLIIIFLLTLVLLNLSIFAFSGLVIVFFTAVITVFSTLPVSLWLGGRLTRHKGTVPGKLAIGLGVISVIRLAFELLAVVPSVGFIFGLLKFILNLAIWLFGAGAILKVAYEMLKSANRQAEAEQAEQTDQIDIMPL